MFRLFECCALSFFERFVLSFSLKIERFVSDSAEIWICGLYIRENQPLENKLKDIVLFFAIVSIILTLLGVYSSITLDTERRQKEVAIRKVNGAGVSQIILLFARLYIILLTGSAVLAFPLLYLVLIQWKRMYTVFFDYGFFFWVGIFMSVAAVTTLTVIFRILRIARQNPAEVIKRE